MEPDEVSSTYEYQYCMYQVNEVDGSVTCRDYGIEVVEVAPLVPPFSYNNLCSSALLTSFIPVFIFVYSFQVMLPIIQLCLFTSSQYTFFPKAVRKLLFGIFWPDFWRTHGAATSAGTSAGASSISTAVDADNVNDEDERDSNIAEPLKLLKANRIISTDILSPLLVFCTFGICSPFLAVIMLVSVSMKLRMWLVLLGRFVYTRFGLGTGSGGAGSAGGDRQSGESSSRGITTEVKNEKKVHTQTHSQVQEQVQEQVQVQVGEDTKVDLALRALGAACVPAVDIVVRCVWPVLWSSSVFFSFLCWDVLNDEVGWREAIWAPVVVLVLPGFLWVCMTLASRGRCGCRGGGDSDSDSDDARRLSSRSPSQPHASSSSSSCSAPPSATSSFSEEINQAVDSNPLHHTVKMTEMGQRAAGQRVEV